jgi:hypothetical protein
MTISKETNSEHFSVTIVMKDQEMKEIFNF